MQSIFLKKQGNVPKNRVLDFLITHQELDYSLKEISRYSGAGYSTVKLIIRHLLDTRWLAVRKVSKIKLYRLDTDNREVKAFIEFYWTVIESEIDQPATKQTANTAQSVSANSQ